jgi:DNA-binding sugar fermentation-stimulating protein
VIRRLIRFFFRVDAGGGKLPAYCPRPGERLAVLSPGGRIDDPDEAEALGMRNAAVRRIGRQADV